MTALTVILTIFLLILTSLFPKYTASETSQIKSWLKIEFSQYPNVISERISWNNYDSDWNIFKITHIVECAWILNEHFTIQSYKNTNNVKMFSIEKFNSILQSHKQFWEFWLIEKDKILQDICNL